MAGKKKPQKKDTVQATLGNLVETKKKPTKKSPVKTEKKKSAKKDTKPKPKKETTSKKKSAKKPTKKHSSLIGLRRPIYFISLFNHGSYIKAAMLIANNSPSIIFS